MSLRPVILGYVRADAAATDDLLGWLHGELASYAEREGFSLAAVFVERSNAGRSALMALVGALRRREAEAVVVPALDHLSRISAGRHALRNLIERESGARVLVMYPPRDDVD